MAHPPQQQLPEVRGEGRVEDEVDAQVDHLQKEGGELDAVDEEGVAHVHVCLPALHVDGRLRGDADRVGDQRGQRDAHCRPRQPIPA